MAKRKDLIASLNNAEQALSTWSSILRYAEKDLQSIDDQIAQLQLKRAETQERIERAPREIKKATARIEHLRGQLKDYLVTPKLEEAKKLVERLKNLKNELTEDQIKNLDAVIEREQLGL